MLKKKIMTAIENYEALDPGKTTIAEQFMYQCQIRELVDRYNDAVAYQPDVQVYFTKPSGMIVELRREQKAKLTEIRKHGFPRPVDVRAEWERTV